MDATLRSVILFFLDGGEVLFFLTLHLLEEVHTLPSHTLDASHFINISDYEVYGGKGWI